MDDRRGVIIVGAGIMQIPVIEAAKKILTQSEEFQSLVEDFGKKP